MVSDWLLAGGEPTICRLQGTGDGNATVVGDGGGLVAGVQPERRCRGRHGHTAARACPVAHSTRRRPASPTRSPREGTHGSGRAVGSSELDWCNDSDQLRTRRNGDERRSWCTTSCEVTWTRKPYKALFRLSIGGARISSSVGLNITLIFLQAEKI